VCGVGFVRGGVVAWFGVVPGRPPDQTTILRDA
jgi:hypothetical protein